MRIHATYADGVLTVTIRKTPEQELGCLLQKHIEIYRDAILPLTDNMVLDRELELV